MEIILLLRKSGILDYFLLESLNFNKNETLYDNLGRQFLKVLFLIILTYREFNIPKKNELKGLIKNTNYWKMLQIIIIHISLFFDRNNIDFQNIYETMDAFSFISLYYILRKDLKT
jgi:hypothetical protein